MRENKPIDKELEDYIIRRKEGVTLFSLLGIRRKKKEDLPDIPVEKVNSLLESIKSGKYSKKTEDKIQNPELKYKNTQNENAMQVKSDIPEINKEKAPLINEEPQRNEELVGVNETEQMTKSATLELGPSSISSKITTTIEPTEPKVTKEPKIQETQTQVLTSNTKTVDYKMQVFEMSQEYGEIKDDDLALLFEISKTIMRSLPYEEGRKIMDSGVYRKLESMALEK